jgi:hypothetical protein
MGVVGKLTFVWATPTKKEVKSNKRFGNNIFANTVMFYGTNKRPSLYVCFVMENDPGSS